MRLFRQLLQGLKKENPMENDMGVSQIRGTLFRGPYNKDYSILASILGSPYFGKLPHGNSVYKRCL